MSSPEQSNTSVKEDKFRRTSALAMSKVGSVFRAITPKSKLESTVLKATSPSLKEPDWKLNMKVCDLIKREALTTISLQEVVRCICHRQVARNAILLLETTVKNGTTPYYKAVAAKGVPKLLKIVYSPVTRQTIRTEILRLIEIWADAFQPVENTLPEFKAAYEELKKRGFEFPPRGKDTFVPVLNFEEDAGLSAAIESSRGDASSSTETDRSIPSLSYSFSSGAERTDNLKKLEEELRETSGIVKLFEETTSYINPEEEEPSSVELAKELYDKVTELHRRLSNLLQSATEENIIAQGLTLNDTIVQALTEFESKCSLHQAIMDSRQSLPTREHSDDYISSRNATKMESIPDNKPYKVPAWLKASVPSPAEPLENSQNSRVMESASVSKNSAPNAKDRKFDSITDSSLKNNVSTTENFGSDNVDLLGFSEERPTMTPSNTSTATGSSDKKELSDPFDELFGPSATAKPGESKGSKSTKELFSDLLIDDQ
eukprot:jgi/Galph1/4786/GphlegSOOS_G3417.1